MMSVRPPTWLEGRTWEHKPLPYFFRSRFGCFLPWSSKSGSSCRLLSKSAGLSRYRTASLQASFPQIFLPEAFSSPDLLFAAFPLSLVCRLKTEERKGEREGEERGRGKRRGRARNGERERERERDRERERERDIERERERWTEREREGERKGGKERDGKRERESVLERACGCVLLVEIQQVSEVLVKTFGKCTHVVMTTHLHYFWGYRSSRFPIKT